MFLGGYYGACLLKEVKGEPYNKNWLLFKHTFMGTLMVQFLILILVLLLIFKE